MTRPKMAGTSPVVLDLAPGSYFYCACGESANQPFCDGSHAGTDFKPIEFTIAEPSRAALCACKCSRKQPFCDGSHRQYREGRSE